MDEVQTSNSQKKLQITIKHLNHSALLKITLAKMKVRFLPLYYGLIFVKDNVCVFLYFKRYKF